MKLIATANGLIDLAVGVAGIVNDTTLETAIIISILTDRRAAADDILPGSDQNKSSVLPQDRRGWAGDALADDRMGSRLWLLAQEKRTEETRQRAIFYCREALQWLLDDDHVKSIDIQADWNSTNTERLDIVIIATSINGDLHSTSISLKGMTYAV